MQRLPPGACPGGGTVRPAGVAARPHPVGDQEPQSAASRQDPMQRGTVRPVGVAARPHPVGDQEARSATSRQDLMQRLPPGACPGGGTVRPAGVAARPHPIHDQAAQSAERGQHPMQRGTVQPGAADAGLRSVCGQEALSALHGQHLMQRLAPGTCPAGETARSARGSFRQNLLATTASYANPARTLTPHINRSGGATTLLHSPPARNPRGR